MSSIVGRRAQQEVLHEAYSSKNAEFLVLYGRRRIGKTYLIKEFFKEKSCTYFHITGIQDGTLKEQLQEFVKQIGKTFYNGATIASPVTWLNAFEELNRAINNTSCTIPVVIFLDELPWLATKRSRILQAIDYYWNHYWSQDEKIKLIVCGSSASWIIKNIIHNKGGLHNRYTRNILLKPFTLSETKEFLKLKNINLNDKQILQLYMVLGGVPHYLSQVKKNLSATQNIDHLCFTETGLLFNEFDLLFKSLFENAKPYIEIINIISRYRQGVSKIHLLKNIKQTSKGGHFTERLSDLEQAGFIKSFLPLEHERRGLYYRIIDEYTYFYLKWIKPIKQTLLSNEVDNQYWTNQIGTPEYNAWRGYTFESVCYKHVAEIRKALKLPAKAHAGTWRYAGKSDEEQGAQIDLLFDRYDDSITLCEIKYTDEPFALTKAYYKNLQNKISIYQKVTRTSKQIFVAFILVNGIKKTIYSEEFINQIVVLNDFYD